MSFGQLNNKGISLPLRFIRNLSVFSILIFSIQLSAKDIPEHSLKCKECNKNAVIPFVRIAALESIMVVASAALWPESYSPLKTGKNWKQFKESWTNPPNYVYDTNILGSDGDWWYFNLLAHGILGSELYLAARDWGYRPVTAGLFAIYTSFVWEYMVEGWFRLPSTVDLFWTPLAGILIGELRFLGVKAAYKIKNQRVSLLVRIMLNPLGELERTIMSCRIPHHPQKPKITNKYTEN